MQAYIKLDEYIIRIQVFNTKYENKKKFYPSIYKIIEIKHMINNEYFENIELYDTGHVCKNTYDNNTVFFRHNKFLKINDLVVYEKICDEDNLIENYSENKFKICIVNKLYPAYIDEREAFYDGFFEEAQWKLYPNGFSGLCKKYDYKYGDNCIEAEEFYHFNDKKEGKHKIYYDYYKNKLKSETNYINGEKNGEEIHYDENGICIEKIYNYSEYFYFYEKYDKNKNIIKSGYYYIDIPVTSIYKFINKIKHFFY